MNAGVLSLAKTKKRKKKSRGKRGGGEKEGEKSRVDVIKV